MSAIHKSRLSEVSGPIKLSVKIWFSHLNDPSMDDDGLCSVVYDKIIQYCKEKTLTLAMVDICKKKKKCGSINQKTAGPCRICMRE